MRHASPVKTLLVFFLSLFCLTGFAQKDPKSDMLALIRKQAYLLPLNPAEVEQAGISSMHTDASSGLQYVYLQQRWQSLNVFNRIVSVAIKEGKIAHAAGSFIDSMSKKAGSPTPSLSAPAAVQKAAAHLGLPAPGSLSVVDDRFEYARTLILSPGGIAKGNIACELMWVTTDEGRTVRLAWNVNIDVLHSADWWNVRVDAQNGNILSKDNWTQYEDNHGHGESAASPQWREAPRRLPLAPWQHRMNLPPSVTSATYLVYPFPAESPNFGSLTVETNPWLKAGAGNNAITNGWHFDGANNYNYTRGNNVFVYDDTASINAPGLPTYSTTGLPTLRFQFTPDFSRSPYVQQNIDLARTNLFYWNNIVHDVTYQYGFNEAAGNFQADNLGRGGNGNDFVRAEASDGGGVSNANFSTPTDGTPGRMQMYLWSTPTGSKVAVLTPAGIAGDYPCIEGSMSANNLLIRKGSVTAQVVYVDDNAGGTTHFGCGTIVNASSLVGKIALIDRGNCNFVVKVKNAQNAGAIGVIVVNNIAGAGPAGMGGSDNSITIPSVSISLEDGNVFKAQLANNLTVTLAPGTYVDGDIDNGVITHEYGHGVSNRLTGGPLNVSCLSHAEQAGEGWSDYLALMVTTDWNASNLTSGALRRAIGTYVSGQAANGNGIRRYPYSTDMSINPLTYGSLTTTTNGTEVHNMGEVWCSALWDMTWNIIQQEGSIGSNIYNATSGGGNIVALRLVIQGMKLQPCNPGFLDGRDAILAADSILYNGIHTCSIWSAFARRGMGVSARQGSVWDAADGTQAFDTPGGVILTRSAVPVLIYPGNQITYSVTAACRCAPVSNFTIRDTIPTGFSYVGSTGGSVTGNVVSFPISFGTPLQKQNISVTLSPVVGACNVDTSIRDDRDNYTTGGLTPGTPTGTTNWRTSNAFASNGSLSWYAPDSSATTNLTLTSAPFTVRPLSILSFKQYRYLENEFDAGRVEVSTDGTTWIDAAPYIVQNPYNTTMYTGTVWAGGRAYSGYSLGFEQTVLDLSSFNGQTLRLRFHLITDANNDPGQFDGWNLDEIMQLNGCGGLIKAGLYDASNNLVTAGVKPVFVTLSAPLPLTLTSFTAEPSGNRAQLRWTTTDERNTASFEVEHSTNGTTWTRIATVAASGTGNHAYETYHNTPVLGLNHYRLKMIDQDGRTMYSKVRTVNFGSTLPAEMTIVPNPTAGATVLYFKENVSSPEILLYNAIGQLVSSQKGSGSMNQYALSLESLSPGSYLVVVRSGGKEFRQKLIVQ